MSRRWFSASHLSLPYAHNSRLRHNRLLRSVIGILHLRINLYRVRQPSGDGTVGVDKMSKVPVGKSIAHAYEFLFGRIFQIIGTAWLPALLYATGYFFWLKNAAGWLAPVTQDHALLTQG